MTARTADALADLLAEIALTPGTGEPTPEAWHLVRRYHPGAESVIAAWQEFRAAVQLLEGLASGETHWEDADPAAGSQEAAGERACERVGAAYGLLAFGPGGGAS